MRPFSSSRSTARPTPPGLTSYGLDLERVLADVRAAIGDREAMTGRAREVASEMAVMPPSVDDEEVAEAQALLEWMADGQFIFLGYREYDLLSEDGDDILRSVPGSGLGILRQSAAEPVSRSFAKLPPEIRRRAHEPNVLNLTRANSRATVHRARYLDYVGVKRFDEAGTPLGERRFVGLYTSAVYQRSPFSIPVLRRKVTSVVEGSGLGAESRSGKALIEALETYPFDELLQISPEELSKIAMDIVALEERQQVRLFVRRDSFGRFFSCLVYLPRDRYNTTIRLRMQDILQAAFGGVNVDYSTRLAESVLVRLHFVVYTAPGQPVDYDVDEIESRLTEATRDWADELYDALLEHCGEEDGVLLAGRYAAAFPAAYRDEFTAAAAVADIRRIEQLGPDGDLAMSLYRPLEAPDGFARFKLFRSGEPIPLSDVLPVLENMGVRVIDERPYEVFPSGGLSRWIYDFGLSYEAGDLETDEIREIFQETFARVWHGDAENDGFNRLTLRAGLSWREVVVLRAYCKYLRQAGTTFSQTYMEETFDRHPAHRPSADRLVPCPVGPASRWYRGGRHRPKVRDRGRHPVVTGRGRQPGRRPDPAELPAPDAGHAAHQLLPVDARRRGQDLPLLEARSASHPGSSASAAALRDLRGLAEDGGRAPAGREGGEGRHPLVRPSGGFPHRDPGAHEGPDGEERGDRPGRGEGRLRGEAASAGRLTVTPWPPRSSPVTGRSSAACST